MMGLNEMERRGLRCLRDVGCVIVRDTADARAKYSEIVRRGYARAEWHRTGLVRVTYVFASNKQAKAKGINHWARWTEQESNRLAELVAEGWSYGAIAKELGRTRNSIKGRWTSIAANCGKQAA